MIKKIAAATIALACTTSSAMDGVSNKRLKEIEDLFACYSRLLDIDTPNYYFMPSDKYAGVFVRSAKIIFINERLVRGEGSIDKTIAHEVRHAWQYQHGLIKRSEMWKPYAQRDYEIDAATWASQNASKCYKQKTKKQNGCISHKVVKGDTWWALKRKYGLSAAWVKRNADKSLRLGESVSICK